MKKYAISFVLAVSCFVFFSSYVLSEQVDKDDKKTFYFGVSSSELDVRAQDAIKRLAQKMACLNLKVLVEGNTDITGNDEINALLSEKRANAVKDYFISLGVLEADIQTVSYGASNPVAEGDSEEYYSKNRRVEVTLIDPKEESFPVLTK